MVASTSNRVAGLTLLLVGVASGLGLIGLGIRNLLADDCPRSAFSPYSDAALSLAGPSLRQYDLRDRREPITAEAVHEANLGIERVRVEITGRITDVCLVREIDKWAQYFREWNREGQEKSEILKRGRREVLGQGNLPVTP